MKKKALSDMTLGEVDDITRRFYTSGSIYRVDFKQLSLGFLSEAMGLNLWEMPFNEIRNLFLKDWHEKDITEKEDEFHQYIVDTFFGYDQEPRATLMEVFIKTTEHLKEVDDRIQVIESEINEIRQKNQQEDIQSKIPVLSYYLDINKNARVKILDFLKTGIYNHALTKSTKFGRQTFDNFPYPYAWNPKAYQVSYPTLISNKFLNLTIPKLRIVQKTFTGDREAFQILLTQYIEEEEIVFSIRDSISESHILTKRSDIISQAIGAFEAGNKILFASICLFLIEGLFHDVCILLGNNENDLLGAGFKEKVDLLQKGLGIDFHYEYYNFRFRLLRNKMAHGLLAGKEAEEVADLLLLDLDDAIKITKSLKIPLNQKRFFHHQSITDKFPDSFQYIAAYLFLQDITVPDHYNIEDKKIIDIVMGDSFWEYIDVLLSKGLEQKALAHAVIKAVMNLKIEAIKPLAVKRLKAITISGLTKLDKNTFIESLIR